MVSAECDKAGRPSLERADAGGVCACAASGGEACGGGACGGEESGHAGLLGMVVAEVAVAGEEASAAAAEVLGGTRSGRPLSTRRRRRESPTRGSTSCQRGMVRTAGRGEALPAAGDDRVAYVGGAGGVGDDCGDCVVRDGEVGDGETWNFSIVLHDF